MTTREAMGVSLLCAGTGAMRASPGEAAPLDAEPHVYRIGVVIERSDCAEVVAEKVMGQFGADVYSVVVRRCVGGVGFNLWTNRNPGNDVFWFTVGVVSGMGLRWRGE